MTESGETSSGKTTFLNALTEFIPSDARVITIEDSAELQVRGIENLVRMESRNKTMEGKLEVTIRDLVKSSLRMRPDRIIVGECRGGEALEMLSAMNTGQLVRTSYQHIFHCSVITIGNITRIGVHAQLTALYVMNM